MIILPNNLEKERRVERALESLARAFIREKDETQRKRYDAVADFDIGRNYPENSMMASFFRNYYNKIKGRGN